ncbi:hypothetical protein [Acinetobacter tibetensis]|uniref:Uncharacterized protein n=1 Tax=Acinetobacter tibetensis TaxID=2943497 RepID=A0AAE9RZR7_9GAMM|nr:hypothetical protein [Acinetobacter tibetensis]USE82388.1 hypothetical protein M5E07_11280 [Acinetobacter tibetensis]
MTGFFLKPQQMWLAFQRGVFSQNLYAQSTRHRIDIHDEKLLKDLKEQHLAEPKKKKIHV